MGGAHSPPRRGGVARQLNRSWRAGVVSSTKRYAGLTTPSAPPARWLSAHPPLLCEEGITMKSWGFRIHEHCHREYTVDARGAILRIHHRQEGGHGCDRAGAIRFSDRAYARQSTDFSRTLRHEPLCRDPAREPAIAVDGSDDPAHCRGFAHLGFGSTLLDQEGSPSDRV